MNLSMLFLSVFNRFAWVFWPIIVMLMLNTATLCMAAQKGNVVFVHPDGTGLGHWNIARLLTVGPDGMSHWDRMDRLAAYRPHQKGWLSTTSHAGATVHAYGRKVHPDSYGLDRDKPLTALSGRKQSIMQEAMTAGIRVGVVNTGHIGEPGTGVFLASNESRKNISEIAAAVVGSGADLILSGGEIYMLPEGVMGRHGSPGVRADDRNLLQEAREAGYAVVFTKEELAALPSDTKKVLGVFAAVNTYNDRSEAFLARNGLELYDPAAPTFADMIEEALRILSHKDQQFFLVAEEEGTDNFSNYLNGRGMAEAVVRADAGIGKAMNFVEGRSDTLLLVTADSDAGHPAVWSRYEWNARTYLPELSDTGALVDAASVTGRNPFLSKPDSFGKVHAFGIIWSMTSDGMGSSVAKAHGFRSDLIGSTFDNISAYRVCYQVLFQKAIK